MFYDTTFWNRKLLTTYDFFKIQNWLLQTTEMDMSNKVHETVRGKRYLIYESKIYF